jgi:hypothetical protein
VKSREVNLSTDGVPIVSKLSRNSVILENTKRLGQAEEEETRRDRCENSLLPLFDLCVKYIRFLRIIQKPQIIISLLDLYSLFP